MTAEGAESVRPIASSARVYAAPLALWFAEPSLLTGVEKSATAGTLSVAPHSVQKRPVALELPHSAHCSAIDRAHACSLAGRFEKSAELVRGGVYAFLAPQGAKSSISSIDTLDAHHGDGVELSLFAEH
jgi:hypothetical protein